MPEPRFCLACGELQEWCDRPECDGLLPRGHWTHLTDTDCPNLGDRNPDPNGPPDFSWMETFRA